MEHFSQSHYNNPQPKSLTLPDNLTVMTDGKRMPNRGIRFWLMRHGDGVLQLNSKYHCELLFQTSEQLMSFKFKFSVNVVEDRMIFKHFILDKVSYEMKAKTRSWLSTQTGNDVYYLMQYHLNTKSYSLLGPDLHPVNDELHFTSFCNIKFGGHFTGNDRWQLTNVERLVEMVNEMRVFWVNAPLKLAVQNDSDYTVLDVTDQDPLFIALML